jgi:hypothetical protein
MKNPSFFIHCLINTIRTNILYGAKEYLDERKKQRQEITDEACAIYQLVLVYRHYYMSLQ